MASEFTLSDTQLRAVAAMALRMVRDREGFENPAVPRCPANAGGSHDGGGAVRPHAFVPGVATSALPYQRIMRSRPPPPPRPAVPLRVGAYVAPDAFSSWAAAPLAEQPR